MNIKKFLTWYFVLYGVISLINNSIINLDKARKENQS